MYIFKDASQTQNEEQMYFQKNGQGKNVTTIFY